MPLSPTQNAKNSGHCSPLLPSVTVGAPILDYGLAAGGGTLLARRYFTSKVPRTTIMIANWDFALSFPAAAINS